MPKVEPAELVINHRMIFTPHEAQLLDKILEELGSDTEAKQEARLPEVDAEKLATFITDTRRAISDSRTAAQEAFRRAVPSDSQD